MACTLEASVLFFLLKSYTHTRAHTHTHTHTHARARAPCALPGGESGKGERRKEYIGGGGGGGGIGEDGKKPGRKKC